MKEKIKKAFHANSFKYGTFSLILSVLVIAIVIGANLVMTLLPVAVTNIDISVNQNYSIGETTEKTVADLSEDVTIYLIGAEGAITEQLIQMTDRYADISSHVKIEQIDPNMNPAFLSNHNLTAEQLSENSSDILVESSKRSKFISNMDIYEVDQQSYMAYVYGYANSYDVMFDGEGEITSAITYVTTDDLPKLYTLEGHEETELDAKLLSVLDQNNIAVEGLNLSTKGAIPEDCNIVMIYKPAADLSADEVNLLENYIAHGGKCMIFNSPKVTAKMPNYDELLNYYGVTLAKNGYIFEGSANCIANANGSVRNFLYEPLGGNSFTEDLSGKYVFAPNSSAILVNDDKRKTLSVTPILSSSVDSWFRTELDSKVVDDKIASDVDGPIDYAVSILDQSNEGEGHVIVFSSEYFLDFAQLSQVISSYANADAFMNILDSMVKLKARVSIPRKSNNTAYNVFTTQELNFYIILFVVVIPIVIIIIGFAIWMVRRRR